jgi:hypothetical protein
MLKLIIIIIVIIILHHAVIFPTPCLNTCIILRTLYQTLSYDICSLY